MSRYRYYEIEILRCPNCGNVPANDFRMAWTSPPPFMVGTHCLSLCPACGMAWYLVLVESDGRVSPRPIIEIYSSDGSLWAVRLVTA